MVILLVLRRKAGGRPPAEAVPGGEGRPAGERRIRMLISGRVQGVCYRAFTRDEANRLSLRGTVRNLPDGRVEVVAEGILEALRELEACCRRGPPYAVVYDVDVVEEAVRGDALPPFRIGF